MKKILFFDCEIEKCIPNDYFFNDSRYEFCAGWNDITNMGIACIGVYTSWSGYHVFLKSQLKEFQKLVEEADEVVGFNSLNFDDKLLSANGVKISTTYDLLREVRIASKQPLYYIKGKTKAGHSLSNLSRTNLSKQKTGNGEAAPALWQQGRFKKVIEYCINDVDLLKELYERRSFLVDPTNGKLLLLRGGSFHQWLLAAIKAWIYKQQQKWNRSDCHLFLWCIMNTDTSLCRIVVNSPIKIRLNKSIPEVEICLKLPSIRFLIPPDVRLCYLKKKHVIVDDDIPF